MKFRIEKQVYGGAGLARHEGKAVFVPFTLAGELVEANAIEDRGSYANAELVSILEPSYARTQPPCAYFKDCGGCHYQHAAYPEQIKIKSQILRESLERARLSDIPEITPLYAGPFGYRNRIRMHIDRATSKLCYRRRASHQNLIVSECPIAAPILQNSLKVCQSHADDWRLSAHFAEAEFFTNSVQDSVLLTLWANCSAKSAAERLASLWPALQRHLPNLAGVTAFSVEQSRRPSKLLAHAGKSLLLYTAGKHNYQVSFGSFFQVNRLLIDTLVEQVTAGSSGALAFDLYAGVGLFSVPLAERFEQVIAVESAPSSVRDLRSNLPKTGSRIVAATTLDFLRRKAGKRSSDFVVVDPPRAGLGKEVTKLLASAHPAHITYVSCDPATLSRDLKLLLDSGYHLNSMHMVDLFPQTYHLESIATLSLK